MYRAIKDYDQNPENPWEAWDCQPPVIAVGGSGYRYGKGKADSPNIKRLTREQIIQHHEEIEQMVRDMSLHEYWTEDEAAEFNILEYLIGGKSVEFGGRMYTSTVEKLVSDSLDDYLSGSMDSEMLDRIEQVWKWAGVQTWRDTLVGYSQGDWLDTLFVAMPKWVKTCGAPEESIDTALESASYLFGAYMFGDVYGVTVEKLISNGDDDAEWEEIDSCWGFYGYDDERSGLAEFVCGAVADWQGEAA
jgi:hypothetical protein